MDKEMAWRFEELARLIIETKEKVANDNQKK